MERFAIKIDKKLKANLYKICRLCGIDNPDMVPIISDKPADTNENACIDVEAELEMQQKINLLLGLSITKDDRMPQTMCCLCVDKINDFYEFREMCYATNIQTRKLLGLKNIKKPASDIKPKVEVKEESIVPTPIPIPAPTPPPPLMSSSSKTSNKKRKTEEVALKEEMSDTAPFQPKKKLRFSTPVETSVKEETSVQTKKKLRFTIPNEDATATSSKKSKNSAIEETKWKKEPSPPVPVPPPAVSNKKLRLAAPQKDLAIKKSKQKGSKNTEQKEAEVKEEIKEEVKEEPSSAASPPIRTQAVKLLPGKVTPFKVLPVKVHQVKLPPAPKLKFGCNICKERFPAKLNLETHRATHIPKVERYVCTACNEVLSKSFDIKNHQLWHKLSKTPYVCGCCGESILNTYAFSRHLREHAFETPPALLVLDRECPQCHTSYATNFLYNIHMCAVKARRCAGCNRIQRNDAEYLKHSAQCAKVYLNYSKHIMPSVEALEDSVRIKNENEVEAAAEEMARISGVSLDMAPVVHLTRLSSPLIMAASQCVSTTGLDDAASTSNKKSGKKGVSKKELKRVDELLKSTLDALVSIKHEPEVHVDQETPCAGEHSDNDDRNETDDHGCGLDDFHHNDETDDENDETNKSNATETNITSEHNTTVPNTASEGNQEQVKIKQEIDEGNEENSNKIGGGLKLKIKKEHGQLNSSIIEQQKSSEKRAEKRKKKKKHKEKEKDKQKLTKDTQDEQDSNINNNNREENADSTAVLIKVEPQDGTDIEEKSVAPVLQARPQPEATIMTSIPMMQFQIACVSSGVEFNNVNNPVVDTQQTLPSANYDIEIEDVKPNRQELDRLLKISHVSSGIGMETDEMEAKEGQQMDHDSNCDKGSGGEDDVDDDYHEESNDDDEHGDENGSEHEEENHPEVKKSAKDTEMNKKNIITRKNQKVITQSKSKLTLKPKDKPLSTTIKSRNKACKSTAKPSNMPILQISAVQSGVTLESSALNTNEFTPVFIKPEPQNRGYSDEEPAVTIPPEPEEDVDEEDQEETEELVPAHTAEEQNYISSIDFNNITIKQEKDIEINDVQITQKFVKSVAKLNGIKRKRKQAKEKSLDQSQRLENKDEYMENEEEHEADEEDDDDNDSEEIEDEEEVDEEEEVEEEDEDEEVDEEEDEEREYRELEYPPELVPENTENETEEVDKTDNENHSKDLLDKQENSAARDETIESPIEKETKVSFVIANVCSEASTDICDKVLSKISEEVNPSSEITTGVCGKNLQKINEKLNAPIERTLETKDIKILKSTNPSGTDSKITQSSVQKSSEILSLSSYSDNKANTSSFISDKKSFDTCLSSDACTPFNSDITVTNRSTEAHYIAGSQEVLDAVVNSFESKVDNAQIESPTLISDVLHTAIPMHLGEPFEIGTVGQTADVLNYIQDQHKLDSTTLTSQGVLNSDEAHPKVMHVIQNPEEDSGQLPKPEPQSHQSVDNMPQEVQFSGQQELQKLTPDSQENIQNTLQHLTESGQINEEYNRDSKEQQSHNSQNAVEQSINMRFNSPQVLLENLPYIQNSENQPQTSTPLQPVFEISSVRTATLNVTSDVDIYPLSNNGSCEISKDNQEGTATIEGVVQQSKDINLGAQPVAENFDNESVNDENEEDYNEYEDENELEEVVHNEEESALGNNLEEQQNYQNQEMLSQIRPTALSLHPYLEDISSSSNSLLSNSLSQTPPIPLQLAASATSVNELNPQRLLHTEETENILNESNDILSRRSIEVAETSAQYVSHPLNQAILGQHLPPQMPTFNFDNINEIAENNNNANIEREQLQDEQHQHQQN